MSAAQALEQRSDHLWEIPVTHRPDMRVPVRVFSSRELLGEISGDRSLEQIVNVSTLPGIVGAAFAMPDVHEGYGFPIGGVAATEWPDGVISPGGIGYDINCGVRLLRTERTEAEIADRLERLAGELYGAVPSGVGRGGSIRLRAKELDRVLNEGVPWAVERGWASESDRRHTESGGHLEEAEAHRVSARAKERGRNQLGTMGAGNHFVEVDRVERLLDEPLARAYGLFQDQIVILIHCGSRGLGHQVATDFIRRMMPLLAERGIRLPDRELACAPFSSPEGREYFAAMAAAANFAWVNRQAITHAIRGAWDRVLGSEGGPVTLLYDVAHNMAKIEQHSVDGKSRRLVVHRKGATRAFGPGHPELAEELRAHGQPVLIPGSMGTASYVLAGAPEAMERSFGSCCHGAGRRLSRHAAKRRVRGADLRRELADRGIVVQAGSLSGLSEEAPFAYKDVDGVVDVVAAAGLARKVARLTPLAVVKG